MREFRSTDAGGVGDFAGHFDEENVGS